MTKGGRDVNLRAVLLAAVSSFLTGAVAGFGFVAASFGISYQFAQRSFRLWLSDWGVSHG
jgi:hypothetical protein